MSRSLARSIAFWRSQKSWLRTGGSRGGQFGHAPPPRPSSHMQWPIRPHYSLKQHVNMIKIFKEHEIFLSENSAHDCQNAFGFRGVSPPPLRPTLWPGALPLDSAWQLSRLSVRLCINAGQLLEFFTRDSCTGRYCWERVLAMGILSVCPSVTTRYGFKARWDRNSRSSPYDSLSYLVSCEVISNLVPLGEEIDQDNLRTKLTWCCRASHEH